MQVVGERALLRRWPCWLASTAATTRSVCASRASETTVQSYSFVLPVFPSSFAAVGRVGLRTTFFLFFFLPGVPTDSF